VQKPMLRNNSECRHGQKHLQMNALNADTSDLQIYIISISSHSIHTEKLYIHQYVNKYIVVQQLE